MERTASPLKWMAEKRARTAGALQRAVLRADALNATVAQLRADLAALDRTIAVWDARLNPVQIGVVHAWKGRYGKRGALRSAIVDCLKCESRWVATLALEDFVCRQLGVAFELPAERLSWRRHSLLGALQALVADGSVERRDVGGNNAKLWRWKQEKWATLAELRAEASATAG